MLAQLGIPSRVGPRAAGVAAAVVLASAVGIAAAAAQSAPPTPQMPPPGDFVREIDNHYMPLDPGTTFHYEGTKDGQPAADDFTVTHQTKAILGVKTTVVTDVALVNGQAEERTFDWFAQDKQGNVWYFGEDSFDRVNGQWVRNAGSWQAGVDGAKPGIVMEANPRVGDFYRQEFAPSHAEDVARVLSTNASVSVPYGSFTHALKTRDWSLIEPSIVEHKYYALGVGQVRTVMVKGGSEESHLVSVTDDN